MLEASRLHNLLARSARRRHGSIEGIWHASPRAHRKRGEPWAWTQLCTHIGGAAFTTGLLRFGVPMSHSIVPRQTAGFELCTTHAMPWHPGNTNSVDVNDCARSIAPCRHSRVVCALWAAGWQTARPVSPKQTTVASHLLLCLLPHTGACRVRTAATSVLCTLRALAACAWSGLMRVADEHWRAMGGPGSVAHITAGTVSSCRPLAPCIVALGQAACHPPPARPAQRPSPAWCPVCAPLPVRLASRLTQYE